LRRFDEYSKFEFPTFCSDDVVGCSVETENPIITAAIDWSWRSVSFILARRLTLRPTGATDYFTESEPYHKTDREQHVE